jgi:hypothetical protein
VNESESLLLFLLYENDSDLRATPKRHCLPIGHRKSEGFLSLLSQGTLRLVISVMATKLRPGLDELKAAADAGDALSQCQYGIRLRDGDGLPIDREEAARYFRMSADQGNPRGQYHYGLARLVGDGIGMDKYTSAEYFAESAAREDTGGIYYDFILNRTPGSLENEH